MSRPRSSASAAASSSSWAGRIDGVRDESTRLASMRSSSSRGRPAATAMRAPSTVSSAPYTAAWARISIEPISACADVATRNPCVIERRAAVASDAFSASTAST